ncbi:unnamed protein product [Prorocentrum cordatum]|uniref:Uncharacterized protein n=1 Tax=Prorocentrum cordatum TaxID=2364126 RepID=A0ABN9QBQ4_9DINO|nr:unnamed protein product [Polarella glacialis]
MELRRLRESEPSSAASQALHLPSPRPSPRGSSSRPALEAEEPPARGRPPRKAGVYSWKEAAKAMRQAKKERARSEKVSEGMLKKNMSGKRASLLTSVFMSRSQIRTAGESPSTW